MRWRLNEQGRQGVDAAARITDQALTNGAPPNDPALRELQKFLIPIRDYAGAPNATLNIQPFIDASKDKWKTMELQLVMMGLKEKIVRSSADMQSRQMAKLAERIAADKKMSNANRIEAIAGAQELYIEGLKIADSIKKPEMPLTNADLREQLLAAEKANDATRAAAQKVAGDRPTVKDVADEAVSGINEVADWVMDNGQLLTLLGGGSIVGYAGTVRHRNKKKKIAVKADEDAKAEVARTDKDSLVQLLTQALGATPPSA
jgi:hypothetical protein